MAGEDKASITAETTRAHVTKAVDVYLQNNVGNDVRDNAVARTRESTFNSLFGANTDPTAITAFTASAKKKIDDLGTAVSTSMATWGPTGTGPAPCDPSPTSNQEQVLQDIEGKTGPSTART